LFLQQNHKVTQSASQAKKPTSPIAGPTPNEPASGAITQVPARLNGIEGDL